MSKPRLPLNLGKILTRNCINTWNGLSKDLGSNFTCLPYHSKEFVYLQLNLSTS